MTKVGGPTDAGVPNTLHISMNQAVTVSSDSKIKSFIWQHILLLVSLYLMTLGVALCIRSSVGSSVISSLPFVFSLAGEAGDAPALSVGGYTIVMNFVLVICQIFVLRKRFEPVQLFQLVVGFAFGWLIDFNMWLTGGVVCDSLTAKAVTQLAGCTVMGIGIAFEVKCGSVTMPGEGITIAISTVTRRPFPKVKIVVDTALVVLAIAASYLFFGRWLWNVVGVGTLFAMIYVGLVVKTITPRIGWFDRLLQSVPGFHRLRVGLARLIGRHN